MCKDGVIAQTGPIFTIRVEVVVRSDAQEQALEKFLQASSVGRARMLVQAEAQSRRESVIITDGE